MNLLQELRERRVFQITSGYVVGGWGVLQFLAFLEDRMRVSPDLVNLIGLTLILLLPTVVTLAWVHGRPGRDTWGRAPKLVVPANVVGIAVLLFFMFQGRELGAVTQTIEVRDEHGQVTERVIPKSAFRRRVLMYYPEFAGAPDSTDVTGETLTYLLSMDLSQDPFIDLSVPFGLVNAMREAGAPRGHVTARPLQRKVARDAHFAHFLTGAIARTDDGWVLDTELHESETGKVVAERTVTAPDLFGLADAASRDLRRDLGLPDAQLQGTTDLPAADITSADIEAVRWHVAALLRVTHDNDWQGAVPLLENAVRKDPHFALAQFLLFGVRQSIGDAAGASVAIEAAMADLYRVPERTGFLIKAHYYYNEKLDADKAVAVLRMWERIYPDDEAAQEQLALFAKIRQDMPALVTALERILAINPARVDVMGDLADAYVQLDRPDDAELTLQRYIAVYPGRADGYEDLADFYSRTGRLEEARSALDEAQLLAPEDKTVALRLIGLDVKQGRFAASERALLAMLDEAKTARDRVRAHARLVDLNTEMARGDEVAEQLAGFHAAVLEIQNPLQANLVYALNLQGLCQVGRPEEALVRLAAVRDDIPAPFDDLVGVGEAWAQADLGRLDEARQALAAAAAVVDQFKFETFRSSLSLVEGVIAEKAGDLPAAVAAYRLSDEQALVRQSSGLVRLARALRLDDQERDAAEVVAEALLMDPAHPGLNLEAAHLAAARGDLDVARDHAARALHAWQDADSAFAPLAEARSLEARLRAG